MILHHLSKRPVSIGRICVTLGILFGIFIIATLGIILLPFRAAGFVCHLRTVLFCFAFVFGIAWGALSFLAIPRSLIYLLRLRRPEASGKHLASGLTTLLLACFPLALGLAGFMMLRMPDAHARVAIPPLTAEQQRLRAALQADVQALAGDIGPRNAAAQYDALGKAAAYLATAFSNAGYRVRRQGYEIAALGGKPCSNLEAEIPGSSRPDEIVVIGAHYDTAAMAPGANDNGSGVAAMLALARAFAGSHPERTVRFVAFVNEEPPFFWTGDMGSLVYARRCRARREQIVAMLCPETLGYYSDEPGSQRYPVPFFGRIYPTTGNFVAFISNLRSKALVRRALRSFRGAGLGPAEGAFLPQWVSGVSLSDHWSFWHEGYPAVMITDTAPYRYRWYHTPEDTPDKLNYDRFALAVAGLQSVVADLAGIQAR